MDYITDDRTEYDISLRIVRFELSPGYFENIIANLPNIEFDISMFKEFYHLRWPELCAAFCYANILIIFLPVSI